MAGPQHDPPDVSMLEEASTTTASTTSTSAIQVASPTTGSSSDHFMAMPSTDGPVMISMSHEEYNTRTSRESVLQRLSEALLRHSLAKIDLSQRGLQASDARLVKMALSQNANLTVLKLGYNNLGDTGVTILAGGIARHKALRLLDLGFNNFGDDGAKALAMAMRQVAQTSHGGTLHTLYLAGNLIGEDGALAIADFIRQGTSLRKLYLTGNRIGPNGVQAITEAILEDEVTRRGEHLPEDDDTTDPYLRSDEAQPRPKGRFEGMQELFLGGTGMSSTGCHAVSRLLERTSCLRVISLPNCDMGDDEIGMLASSIRVNKAGLPLESFQLSFNNMTHKGLEALSNALWGSTTLKELKIDNNDIGDRGAHQIAAILPALKKLETLDVGFNSIKAPGINILMKAVADTDQIRSLSMSGNALDLPSARAVAYALAYNQSLTSIHLVHCSINAEARRYITAGAVSNPLTSLRVLTGFDMGQVVADMGFPSALKHWNNEQVMNFIHLMYDKQDDDPQNGMERELDPLNFLSSDCEKDPIASRPAPLESSIVVEIAKKAYQNLVANGVDIFSRRGGVMNEPSFGSPLASDTIMIEATPRGSTHSSEGGNRQNGDRNKRELLVAHQAQSFVAPPETQEKKSDIPDPARKKRIVEWLCSNIQHLNELAQLPFSSRELWRLHQHYFTPVVNESGGTMHECNGDAIASSVPEVSRTYQGFSGTTTSIGSSDEHLAVPVSDPALPGSPAVAASLPMLKRKVSYRFLGDAAFTSQPRIETKMDHVFNNGSVARLIEDGPTGHSLPPKTKRARRNRTRISFVPRIKAKLDSYMDVCHEKALITMRQLYFVEQAILKGQVNPVAPSSQPRIHLSGVLASEAEMIIVDMI